MDFIKGFQRRILFESLSFSDEKDGLCFNPFYGWTEGDLYSELNMKLADEEENKKKNLEYMKEIKKNYRKILHTFKCVCFNNKFMYENKKYPFEVKDNSYKYMEKEDKIKLDAIKDNLVSNAKEPSDFLLSLLCDKRVEEFIF